MGPRHPTTGRRRKQALDPRLSRRLLPCRRGPHSRHASLARCAESVGGIPLWLVFRSFSASRLPASRPHRPDSAGASRGALRRFLPRRRSAARAVRLKGERPEPNSRAQKKTMKTKSNHQSSELKNRPEQLRTDNNKAGQHESYFLLPTPPGSELLKTTPARRSRDAHLRG